MGTTQWLFVAAAKGLQDYVLRSDPLMEMIGGSELIEQLPRSEGRGFLGRVLAQLQAELGPYAVLTDASGAARLLFTREEAARRLARLWPLLAAQFAPGLETLVALVEVKPGQLGEAIAQAEREINVHRNQPAVDLPEAGPWVARNRRTGLPAAQRVPVLDEEDRESKKRDAVDNESARKREAARLAGDTLLRKVVPPARHAELIPDDLDERVQRWPLNLTQLASDDNSYLAVIHADANGLGAAMMACTRQLQGKPNSEAAEIYTALCKAIEDASQAAARTAMRRVIQTTLDEEEKWTKRQPGRPHDPWPIPARPIVCAGEDFTVVIQARHAIQFVEDYLIAIEQQTASEFARLPEAIPGLAKHLTACAGVVFCKSHFPFSRAYALAERLCAFAKKRTERQASALAFLRLKSALQPSDDYEAIVEHAFAAGTGAERVVLTMNPYHVGQTPADGLPSLAALRLLVKALEHERLPRSGVRGLVSHAYEGKAAADQAFERLKLVVTERAPAAVAALETSLRTLTGAGLWKPIPAGTVEDGQTLWVTPLYDALELRHLGVTFAEPDRPAATS